MPYRTDFRPRLILNVKVMPRQSDIWRRRCFHLLLKLFCIFIRDIFCFFWCARPGESLAFFFLNVRRKLGGGYVQATPHVCKLTATQPSGKRTGRQINEASRGIVPSAVPLSESCGEREAEHHTQR